jgi:TPR repeat protein
VAEPWDVPPKPADLPDPELNPLMNPTLGKNLGRWAQVYFTSSPETREQAVGQLLRELERGESVGAYPANNDEPIQRSESSANAVRCPRCNEWNTIDQNFCGICGTRIPAVLEQPPAPRVVTTQEPRPNAWTAPASSSNDPAWLRDSLFSADDEPQHSSRKAWIFAVLALLLLLAGAAYLQYAPAKRASTPTPAETAGDSDSTAPAGSQPASNTASSASQPTPNAASPAAPPPVTANAQPAPGTTTPAATPEPKTPATEKSAPKNPAPADETASTAPPKAARAPAPPRSADRAPSVDNGSRELAEAQRLLQGSGATRNPEVAASLLWKSVKKENAGAEVQLADLYARGQGVSKNCEQARLLLTAAAKRGASDAAQKLRQLQSGGCQ